MGRMVQQLINTKTMKKVRIFSLLSAKRAEEKINEFIATHPENEIVDIKVAGDGSSSCMTYVLIYQESPNV